FGVLVVADLAIRPRAQIGSKNAVFLKHPTEKGHIGAKWSIGERTGLRAQVKYPQRGFPEPLFHWKPGWRCAGPLGEDRPSSTRPLTTAQTSREIPQPGGLHRDVVIHEDEHVTPSLLNSGVQGVRFALSRFEK